MFDLYQIPLTECLSLKNSIYYELTNRYLKAVLLNDSVFILLYQVAVSYFGGTIFDGFRLVLINVLHV